MRKLGLSKALQRQYREALRQHTLGRVGNGAIRDASSLPSFAQLTAEARNGVQRIRDVHNSLQSEIQELKEGIPLLVKSIWGAHASAVVTTMRQRQANVARLIRQWQDAEYRLIAVANSLTSLQTGQKLVAVGGPLAAAHLLGSPASVQCYTSPALARGNPLVEATANLGMINSLVARLAEEITLLQRGVFLFFLFLPMVLTAPVMILSDNHRESWLKLMIWTLEHAGPAFIKWGQWAATRPDLFAPDVCDALAGLQTNAPSHSFSHTKKTVESAFGRPLELLFEEFDEDPVASGSIAQVHRAVLSPEGAQRARRSGNARLLGGLIPLPSRPEKRQAATFADGATVAVKVRHPRVTDLMERDFSLMRRAASIAAVLPGGAGPQLKESLMQFGAPMREQLDLCSEAEHLAKFAENFKWWDSVRFPLPAAPPLVTSDVLVESFEEGEHISKYLGTDSAYNRRLAGLGMNCYLKMLLRDNFIHADLHPGNILVRLEQAEPGSIASRIGKSIGWEFEIPRLVLLDVGMTAKLTQDDQSNLVGFFSSLTSMDGGALAEAILKFAESDAADPHGFRSDMASLFTTFDADYMRENSQQVIGWMMDTIRKHQVHLKGIVSTVVFSSMVLEGWSTKLDPDIRIVETLKGVLPSAWKARAEAAIDKVVQNQSMLAMSA